MNELEIGFSASATRQEQLNELMEQIMGTYSVSDDEGPLTDAVEAFLNKQQHLTVRRHGDTLVASTNFGRERRVILAGHLDGIGAGDRQFPAALAGTGRSDSRGCCRRPWAERVIWGAVPPI